MRPPLASTRTTSTRPTPNHSSWARKQRQVCRNGCIHGPGYDHFRTHAGTPLGSGLFLLVQEVLVQPVGLLLAAVDDLRVTLQRVEVRVAEHLLHQAHIATRHL